MTTYTIQHDSGFEVTLEIDPSILTEDKAHEINNFWGGAEERIGKCGDVYTVIAKMLARRIFLFSMTSIVPVGAMFDRKSGYGVEGWPSLDGSEGITLITYDDFDIDSDDLTVEVS
jgi:hypothetical protein